MEQYKKEFLKEKEENKMTKQNFIKNITINANNYEADILQQVVNDINDGSIPFSKGNVGYTAYHLSQELTREQLELLSSKYDWLEIGDGTLREQKDFDKPLNYISVLTNPSLIVKTKSYYFGEKEVSYVPTLLRLDNDGVSSTPRVSERVMQRVVDILNQHMNDNEKVIKYTE